RDPAVDRGRGGGSPGRLRRTSAHVATEYRVYRAFELPIAVAILLAHQGLKPPPRSAFLGELALDGTVRHVDGVLVAARWLRRRGYERVFVPHADAGEAGFVDGIDVIPCLDLSSVMRHLAGVEPIAPVLMRPPDAEPFRSTEHDLAEVHGQEEARRALE